MIVTAATSAAPARRRTRSARTQQVSSRQPLAVEQGRPGRASFGTYLVATILITAALLFYVFLHVGNLRVGYELSQTRGEQLKLVQDNRALKTEIGTLSAPARVRGLASEKLGMVPAERIVNLIGGAR